MKYLRFTQIITQLVGAAALDYDWKDDGQLVVIDAQGKRYRFSPAEYESLVKEGRKVKAGTNVNAGAQAKRSRKGGHA